QWRGRLPTGVLGVYQAVKAWRRYWTRGGGSTETTANPIACADHSAQEELRVRTLQFDLAINNMVQGLCFFDRSQRLIVSNRRYVEMYRLDPARVVPGVTLREIVDMRFAVGTCPEMGADEYLKWRDTINVSDQPSDTTVKLKDGRIFQIRHRPMASGGWVATHEDITEREVALETTKRLLAEREEQNRLRRAHELQL